MQIKVFGQISDLDWDQRIAWTGRQHEEGPGVSLLSPQWRFTNKILQTIMEMAIMASDHPIQA